MKIKTMLLCALALGCACAFGEITKDGESSGVAVQKLQTCDFLLNKDFKKNAKYYLCLFSASWCPPCRAEMPRIAKTYAETLKDDPNIELIHFSCDQNDEKALAWAKEHDVKFPVVKPNGGNPLDLHTRGIPHLFIVKADGTLIEEGHPMKLFTEEKLNALKAGEPTEPETVTEKTRKAIAKLFPGWSLDSEVPQGGRQPEHSSGFHASHRGRNNIIRLHPMNRDTPVVLSRMVKLPDNNPCLALCVSSWNDDADFLLSVRVNGKDALTNRLVCTPDAVPWEDIVVPLSPWRGRSVKLEIILSANNWWCEWSHLARVDIIEADGDMRINEGKWEVDGYTWSYRAQNGEATIVAENDGRFSTAVSPCPVGSITIPTEIAGAKVTHIGRDAFRDCSALTSVTIPEGVVCIGRGAFYDCTGLKSIKIPSSVKIIERDAFGGCNALASVSIPEGVTIIDRRAFGWCCGLESIEIPPSVMRIGRDAFFYCLGLTSVTIPENVVDIGPQAFRRCTTLASVTIPASVTNISDTAFCDTGALTSFQVDPGNRYYKSENGLLLTKDGTTLVRGVNGDATIPPSVTAIGACAFEGCVALRSAEIPSGVKSIGPFAFKQCRGMKSVMIPSSVTDIGQQAFFGCGSLTSVTMRGERPNAPNNIFERCGNLKAIYVPANAKSWAGMKDWFGIPLVFGGESKAGDSWNSAQDVEYKFNYKLDDKGNAILTGVSPKPEGALVCPNIIEGHKVTGIDRGAFNGCDKMTKIMLPEHLETLPVWVSGWCIHGSIFYGCSALSSIGISEKNSKFASVDGALYSKDKKVLFAYPKDRTEIKVCRETTSIQGDAFHSSLLFKKINIPEGISYTGGFAFSACPNLEEVIFPKEFGSINHHAFSYCPKMKKVVFLGDAPEAYWRRTASRENVFYGAARDIVVYVRKGSKGWNGKDSTDLPGRWPLDGSDSRPIRYIDEAAEKMNDAFSLNAAPGSITEIDLGNVPPLQFVYCPAGKFSMGYKEQPAISKVKDVEITSPFWVSKTVIRADQLELLGLNSITNTETGDAVINDGSIVLEKLPSALKERFGKMLPPGYVFRLPTEAEFEYLQKAETNDKNAQANIWGVERLYSGGLIALLDKAPAYGRVDVVRRRNHRGVIMTDLVKVNYENQPDKDPVGWTDDPTWSVFRRGLARNCGGGKLVTAPGGGKYHYSFYFVVAPDIDKLNKFYWK